jgi:hypothetical protein
MILSYLLLKIFGGYISADFPDHFLETQFGSGYHCNLLVQGSIYPEPSLFHTKICPLSLTSHSRTTANARFYISGLHEGFR